MSKKESVIQHIQHAKSLVFDSNTFLKVRVERTFYIGEGLGGGNLLIALGLFSALSYLAKMYVLLSGYWKIPNLEEIQDAKEVYRQMDKNTQQYFFVKRQDQVNETDAFKRLLSDPNCPQNFGIDETDYPKVYSDIRNHLSHRILPNHGYVVVTFQTNENEELAYGEVMQRIKESNKPVFEKNGNSVNCFVDLLGRDVEKISDWLIWEINAGKFPEENIDEAYKWLEAEFENK